MKSELPRVTQTTNGTQSKCKVTFQWLISGDRIWAIYNDQIFDLSDYINSQSLDSNNFNFLNDDIVSVWKQQPGQDITDALNKVLAKLSTDVRDQNMACISNLFFQGKTDFRKTARCQVQNILLLVVSIILMASVAIKCTCASVLGSNRL